MKYLDYPGVIPEAHLLVDRSDLNSYVGATRVDTVTYGSFADPSGKPEDEVTAYFDEEDREAVLYVPDCKTWAGSISCIRLVRDPEGTRVFKEVSDKKQQPEGMHEVCIEV